jgi:hypothetical protein
VEFASWRQITAHDTRDGVWCVYSEVSLREGAAFRGCPDGCPDAKPELVTADVPWPAGRFVGDNDTPSTVGAVAC